MSAGVQMDVFVYRESDPLPVCISFTAGRAPHAAVRLLPPAGSFDNGGGGSRDQDITA